MTLIDCYAADMKQATAWVREHRSTLLLLLITAMLIAVIRVPSLGNPRTQIRNADERGMFESSLAPFLGVPPTWMGWPGGAMRYAMLMVTPVTFVLSPKSEISADGFVKFLADYATHWEYPVWIMRTLSMIFVSIGFASIAIPIRKLSGSSFLGVIGAIAASVVPAVWQRSLMGTADGMGLGFAAIALSIATVCTRSPKAAILTGMFLGFAMGTKITMMLIGPVVLLALMLAPAVIPISRWKTFLLFALAGAISFVLADPYLITEPIRSLKAIFGNLLMRSAQGSLEGGLRIGMTYWMLLLGLGGVAIALVRHDFRMAAGPSITVLLAAILVARSPQIDPHYFAPLAPMWAILAFGVLPGAIIKWLRTKPAGFNIGAGAVTVLLLGAATVDAYRTDRQLIETMREYYSPAYWCAEQADAAPKGARVAIPTNPINVITRPFTPGYLKRKISSEVETLYAGEIRRIFSRHYKLPEMPFVMLPSLFTENERLNLALLQLAQARATDGGLDLTVWVDFPALQAIVKIPTRDEIARDFRAGKFEMIITDEELSGLKPAATFRGGKPLKYLYCYRKSN